MRNILPVSARRLARWGVETESTWTRDARLFPFFSREGRVEWVLLLRPAFGQMYLVRWNPGLFAAPCLGPVYLASEWDSLPRITAENARAIESLWHFDPWRVLSKDRYAVHWAAAAIKATNCAGRMARNVKMVYFRRDLSQLTNVLIEEKGSMTLTQWKEGLLPELLEPDRPARARSSGAGWRLEPIWERWTVG